MKQICGYCGKTVKLNKLLFGSLHFCVGQEKRRIIEQGIWMMKEQEKVNFLSKHKNDPILYLEKYL